MSVCACVARAAVCSARVRDATNQPTVGIAEVKGSPSD